MTWKQQLRKARYVHLMTGLHGRTRYIRVLKVDAKNLMQEMEEYGYPMDSKDVVHLATMGGIYHLYLNAYYRSNG